MTFGHIEQIWIYLRSSLWFLPTALVLLAVILAFTFLSIDIWQGKQLISAFPLLLLIDAEGARTMLGVIAGSMATVVGVVFSIVIVALALASSQYTSRVLRNFMRDLVTQIMLGTFTGIFIYCLLVLRVISRNQDAGVPSVSIMFAVILALLGFALFIFFIHHIASSIQASEIIKEITTETRESIKLNFVASETKAEAPIMSGLKACDVQIDQLGYIQSINIKAMQAICSAHNARIKIKYRVGQFLYPGTNLFTLYLNKNPSEKLINSVTAAFSVGSFRTSAQDPEFGFRQLVDIALKALSPSINDTTTAVICVQHLMVLLKETSDALSSSAEGINTHHVSVVETPPLPNFKEMLDLAFLQILENAKGNSEIYRILLNSLDVLKSCVYIPHNKDVQTFKDYVTAEIDRANLPPYFEAHAEQSK